LSPHVRIANAVTAHAGALATELPILYGPILAELWGRNSRWNLMLSFLQESYVADLRGRTKEFVR